MQIGTASLPARFIHGQIDGQLFHRLHVIAQPLWQTDDDVEAPVALKQHPGFPAAHCNCNCFLNVPDIDAQACGLLAVDMNRQHRQARGLFDLDVGGAGNLLQHFRNLPGGAIHRIHVVAEYFDRHVAAHA